MQQQTKFFVASSASQAKLEDLQRELEKIRELVNNRHELNKLHRQYRGTLKKVLEMDIKQFPELVIVETTICKDKYLQVFYII